MEDLGTDAPKKTIGDRVWYRVIICAFTAALLTAVVTYGLLAVVFYGPSPTARDLYVASMVESGVPERLERVFFSEERVQEILEGQR